MRAPSINERLIRGFVETQAERLLGAGAGSLRVLDVGCGTMPYRELIGSRVSRYVGVDVKLTQVDGTLVVAHAAALPFRPREWDVVLATEVLEHLPDVGAFLREARRILRPAGLLLVSWPFVHPLHEVPNDYFRLTEFGIQHLIKESGFVFEVFERRGNLLLTTWAMWSNVARGALSSMERRLDGRYLVGTACGIAGRLLGLADRGAIAITGSSNASAVRPGDGLSGMRGVLTGLPLGYCAVLKRTNG